MKNPIGKPIVFFDKHTNKHTNYVYYVRYKFFNTLIFYSYNFCIFTTSGNV